MSPAIDTNRGPRYEEIVANLQPNLGAPRFCGATRKGPRQAWKRGPSQKRKMTYEPTLPHHGGFANAARSHR